MYLESAAMIDQKQILVVFHAEFNRKASFQIVTNANDSTEVTLSPSSGYYYFLNPFEGGGHSGLLQADRKKDDNTIWMWKGRIIKRVKLMRTWCTN